MGTSPGPTPSTTGGPGPGDFCVGPVDILVWGPDSGLNAAGTTAGAHPKGPTTTMGAEFDSGMMFNTPAWHGLGKVVTIRPESWTEARELAGVTWEPTLVPVYRLVDGEFVEVADTKLIERSDTHAVLARGVSDTYALIDHVAMGEISEALLDVSGNALKIESLVSLRGGKQIAAVLQLDEPFMVPGDNSPIYPLLALHNDHTGEGGCKALSTTFRTICANTLAANEANAERHGRFYTFRHRGDWSTRIDEAKAALSGVRQETSRFIEVATDLAALGIVERHVDMFLSEFIPMPPAGLVSDRVVENVEKARAAFRGLLASPTCAEVSGTAWGLVQAATEYLDHVRPAKSQSTLMGRSVLRPEPLKAKAVTLVRELVGAN